ncbi:MAG TPA: tail fiber domain-containing protein [Leadbetterella sp.]|nr:tail fiber domain-containing protein [Leadbetterella sp.]
MKKILFFSLFISLKMLGQTIELKPGSNGFVMIPNVSSLGTCATVDKGKIVYYSIDNSLRICNGSNWTTLTGFSLPYANTVNAGGYILNIQNTNPNTPFSTIHGTTNAVLDDAAGVTGRATNTAPTGTTFGISGTNASLNSLGAGVSGFHSGTGSAIRGTTFNGIAGNFQSANGYGIKSSGKLQLSIQPIIYSGQFLKSTNSSGDAEWGDLMPLVSSQNATQNILEITNTNTGGYSTIVGKTSTTGSGSGVEGIATYTGSNSNSRGVTGINMSNTSTGSGVYGFHAGSGAAVGGYSSLGRGINGETDNGIGVRGYADGASGIAGHFYSTDNSGVVGKTNLGYGVLGESTSTGIGGFFTSTGGYALVTNLGNVGIGTTTPAAKMDIAGTTNITHFYFGANEDTYIRGGKAGSKVLINDQFGMGSVGIGLSNPNDILDVNGRMRIRHTIIGGNPYTSGLWMSNSTNSLNGADGAFYGMKNDTETGIYIGNAWRFWVNNAGNGYLNGNLIQTSDKRLKKDLSLLNNSLSNIYKLNGYHYKWIEESRSKAIQTGLIAQEVQQIFPELVQTDEKGFLSVNYIGLVPHLIEAIKLLKDENDSLKNNKQVIESRLRKIEAILNLNQQNSEKSNSKK